MVARVRKMEKEFEKEPHRYQKGHSGSKTSRQIEGRKNETVQMTSIEPCQSWIYFMLTMMQKTPLQCSTLHEFRSMQKSLHVPEFQLVSLHLLLFRLERVHYKGASQDHDRLYSPHEITSKITVPVCIGISVSELE